MNKVSVAMLVVALVLGLSPRNTSAAGPAEVNLGSSGGFVILTKTGISTTGSTSVVGDIGVSPAAATYLTGFALNLSAESAYAISPLVTGKVYAPGYAAPTPSMLTTAVNDMQTAYTNAMGRTNPTATELGAGNISGMTLAPGLYKWSTGVTIPADVTLSGSANDVWIFQIAQNLNISSGKKVILSGGARAANIFWVVAGQATLGTNSEFNGNILSQTAIVLNTGAVLNGRALAQTAVTLDANAVTFPSSSTSASSSSSTSSPNSSSNSSSSTSNNSSNSASNANNSSAASNTTNDVVCPPGHTFKETTGERCTANTNLVSCPPGQMFNEITGARCNTVVSASAPGASGYTFGSASIRQGNRGEACRAWQRFFNDKRSAGLAVDGICGPLTISAARAWQTSVGLSADGILGPMSRGKANIE